MVQVRTAIPEDAQEILSIYTPYILHTAYTFETEIPSVADFSKRIGACLQKFPWIVCRVQDQLAGYVYATTHRERVAYQWTCECSVYVKEGFQGKGIGSELYHVLFQILKWQGFFNVYAGITQPNKASEALHQRLGFEQFALYEKIGYKLGDWHNVGWWKLRLNEIIPEPPPPVYFLKLDTDTLIDLYASAAQKIHYRF